MQEPLLLLFALDASEAAPIIPRYDFQVSADLLVRQGQRVVYMFNTCLGAVKCMQVTLPVDAKNWGDQNAACGS